MDDDDSTDAKSKGRRSPATHDTHAPQRVGCFSRRTRRRMGSMRRAKSKSSPSVTALDRLRHRPVRTPTEMYASYRSEESHSDSDADKDDGGPRDRAENADINAIDIIVEQAVDSPRNQQQSEQQLTTDYIHRAGQATPSAISLNLPRLLDVSAPPSPGFLSLPLSPREGTAEERNDIERRLSFIVKEKLHDYVRHLRRRTTLIRDEIIREPSPEVTEEVEPTVEAHEPTLASQLVREESRYSLAELGTGQAVAIGPEDDASQQGISSNKGLLLPSSIDPFGNGYIAWLALVVLAFLYNAFAIPLRCSYPYQTWENLRYWLFVDYACDALYLCDLAVVKPRLTFMRQGITVFQREPREMGKNYVRSGKFRLDLIAMIPLDVFYALTGPVPAWRVLRTLKIRSFWELFNLLDSSFSNAFVIRIAKTFSYMIYLIHCQSCVYYTLSAWQAFGQIPYRYGDALAAYNASSSALETFGRGANALLNQTWRVAGRQQFYLNKWVYNGEGNAYIRCFYFTAAVATSTGNNPAPTNVIEYIYMTFSWMMGVFVFALLLGQIRDIVSNANSNQEEFRTTMDKALGECKRLELPERLTEKVRAWFLYTWEQQKTLDEKRLIEKLPLKLQTDLALSVHYTTLSKVKLFQDADKALLRELVLQLRPVIFLPGDMICCKGDVGKEMYIVNNGVLEVVGGEQNELVFATLTEGSAFGEISLLAIGGNNRRTANIRSKGYSTLFVLSKEDLEEVLKDHPEAAQMLKKKAREILEKDKKKDAPKTKDETKHDLREKCRISTEIKTPRMLELTLSQLLPRHSRTSQQLADAMALKSQRLEQRRSAKMRGEMLRRQESGREMRRNTLAVPTITGGGYDDADGGDREVMTGARSPGALSHPTILISTPRSNIVDGE